MRAARAAAARPCSLGLRSRSGNSRARPTLGGEWTTRHPPSTVPGESRACLCTELVPTLELFLAHLEWLRDGALRPNDPAAPRRGPHRHRSLRRRAAPAVLGGRARRPLLPRLSQLALPVHRRQAADGGPHRAGRDRRRRSRSSSTRASSCSARRSSGSRCPTTSSRASRARARSAGSGSSSTRPPGFIDPGWDGHVTLELSNVANLPITIYFGMKIGQISFVQMTEPAESPYGSSAIGSKYQGQAGPDGQPLLAELRGGSEAGG